MPKCCPCQKKGRCISCACVKAGNRCSDCWPSTAGQCRNQQHSDELDSQSLSVASSLPSHSSPPCVSSSSGEVNLINTANIANCAPQVPMTLLPANYHWGDLDGSSLEQTINAAYEVVVHWRQNTFLVPYGKGGCQFVRELARLYRAYADATVLESVALKACAILPHLLLQKPHPKSKSKEHCTHLARRLSLWEKGGFAELMNEGQCIQNRLQNLPLGHYANSGARQFDKLMKLGKVKSALRLISREGKGNVLSPNSIQSTTDGPKSVLDILIAKHPPSTIPPADILLNGDNVNCLHTPIIFEAITGEVIIKATLHTQGAAGPSGLDAYAWRRLSTSFKGASSDLCDSLAAVTRRICSTNVNPEGLSAFTAS